MLGTWINLGMNGSLNLSVYDTLPYIFIIAIKIEEGSLAIGCSYELTSKGNNSLRWLESNGSWNVYGAQLAIRVRELNRYTVIVNSNNEAYGSVSGGGTYEEGTDVVIPAMPNGGYRFVQWEDGNVENPRTIMVTSDSTFVAMFEAEQVQQFTITVLSSNEAYGSVSGGGTYYDGDTVAISAMPYEGYSFVSWDDGDEFNPRTIVVTSDSTFIANFAKCEINYSIDTVVPNFVTIGDHTFYTTGNYTFMIHSETGCDTIFNLQLRVLAEPVYDIHPNPTKSLLNVISDGFISYVELYSVAGQLVMRRDVYGYEAVLNLEGLVEGVYVLRIYGEDSCLPTVSKIVKE